MDQLATGSKHWQERAAAVLPAAGFGNFDPSMILARGKGSRVWDEDGNEFIDLLIGSGPMILGHGNEEVADAVAEQMGKGLTFFTNNAAGIELAEQIVEDMNCAEQVRRSRTSRTPIHPTATSCLCSALRAVSESSLFSHPAGSIRRSPCTRD